MSFAACECPCYYGCLDCDRLKLKLWLFFIIFFLKPLKSLSETVHIRKTVSVCVCVSECVFALHTEM